MSDMLGLLRSIAAEAEALGADLAADLITQKQARIRIQNIHGLATPTEVEGLRGLGSASALEVEAGHLSSERDAVLALQRISNKVSGERIAQFIHNYQRIEGTEYGLRHMDGHCQTCDDLQTIADSLAQYRLLASATKPEASPSPENRFGETATDDQAAVPLVASTGAESPRTTPAASPKIEDGAAIRPRAEVEDCLRCGHPKDNHVGDDYCNGPTCVEAGWTKTLGCTCAGFLTSTTTAEPSPSPDSSRPVSTDEEEGQGLEDGGLLSRPSGGESVAAD